MKILVDMDDVIADFGGAFYNVWRKKYPDKFFVAPEARTKFYVHEEHLDMESLAREIYLEKGFFRSFGVIPGSIEAIKEILKSGHEVFLCTSPITRNQYCIPEKIEWVQEHLGEDFIKRCIFTKDKTLIKGDILIDDQPEVEGLAFPEWEHVIFDRPYNQQVTGKRRITWDNWRDVLEL